MLTVWMKPDLRIALHDYAMSVTAFRNHMVTRPAEADSKWYSVACLLHEQAYTKYLILKSMYQVRD